MRTAKKIIEDLEHLPPRDRRKVLRHLERSLAERRLKAKKLRAATPPSPKGPYTALLELTGVGHSDYTDVSTDKYKHLAAAYGDRHEPT